MWEETLEKEFTIEAKTHTNCISKGCNGRILIKRDGGDGKHCSKCLKRMHKSK